MSIISDLHNKAMELAEQADAAKRRGDPAQAQQLYLQALHYEHDAATRVPPELEPTRSVLYRSAASLAIDCGDLHQAERLIGMGLAGDGPEEIRDELRDLYESITFRRHLELRGVSLSDHEIQLSLAGDAIGFGIAPFNEYYPRVQVVSSLLLRTAERKRGTPFRENKRPTKALLDDFSMYVSTERAASFAVTIRLGKPQVQQQLFYDDAEEVARDFIDCLRYFNDEDRGRLRAMIPDNAYYRNFIHQARVLAPDGRRVRTVGFRRGVGDPTNDVVMRGPVPRSWYTREGKAKSQIFEGELKEAKSGDRSNHIGLKASGGWFHFRVPTGMMDDIVRPLWGRKVILTATPQTNGGFLLSNIEPLEDIEERPQRDEVDNPQAEG